MRRRRRVCVVSIRRGWSRARASHSYVAHRPPSTPRSQTAPRFSESSCCASNTAHPSIDALFAAIASPRLDSLTKNASPPSPSESAEATLLPSPKSSLGHR